MNEWLLVFNASCPAFTTHFNVHCLITSWAGEGCWFFTMTQKLGRMSQKLVEQATSMVPGQRPTLMQSISNAKINPHFCEDYIGERQTQLSWSVSKNPSHCLSKKKKKRRNENVGWPIFLSPSEGWQWFCGWSDDKLPWKEGNHKPTPIASPKLQLLLYPSKHMSSSRNSIGLSQHKELPQTLLW